MRNIKRKFENEIKNRINIISCANSKKTKLFEMLIKDGVFEGTDFMCDDNYIIFPTEILCSYTKSNVVNIYLTMKKEEDIVRLLKNNILNSLYEAHTIFENKNHSKLEKKSNEFKKIFCGIMYETVEASLNNFYEENNIEEVFKNINFNEILNTLKKINGAKSSETVCSKDDYLWKTYFSDFEINFKKLYYIWVKKISKYYADNEDGIQFLNEEEEAANKFSNNSFKNLCKVLYGLNSSCSLMIERAYIEVPSSKEQFSEIVYIDYVKDAEYKNITKLIEERICQDYKELFVILADSTEDVIYFSKFKSINKRILNKRMFCILNEFASYKDNRQGLIKGESLIDTLKFDVSRKMGIAKEKIIVTDEFKDIDKETLQVLNTCNDLLQLLKFIKKESEDIRKPIKIKFYSKDNIINISLNQERMSVQALMGMLYERYHGYLVESWNKIINNNENDERHNRYYYSEAHTIIRNRKDDYKKYRYISYNQNQKKTIDFSLRNGDYNDSKKILKMLVNYGYNIIGFDSNENKIIININGEISEEDKAKLIKSIKGRLEECAVYYFENAFLMNISRKKFNTNSLYKALEIEKNITIDDFYSAFKEVFKKMSHDIVRYEVSLQ